MNTIIENIRAEIIKRVDKRRLSEQAKNELVSILSFLSDLEKECEKPTIPESEGEAISWKPTENDLMMLEHIIGQYEIGNKNCKTMGYLPRVEELSFLKKVLSKWKN